MIYGTPASAKLNPIFAASSLLSDALSWAAQCAPDSDLGRFDLRGEDLYAMVQRREPLPRTERVEVEAHREYFDLQYCIGGGECIDWYALDGLEPTTDYDSKKDFQLYKRPSSPPFPLVMQANRFALLSPGDAHVPNVSDGVHSVCNMIVFKIRVAALAREFSARIP